VKELGAEAQVLSSRRRIRGAHGVGGHLAPVRDPGALAGIIAGVLDDPQKAAAIGAAGRSAALELSWERKARLTLGAYDRVTGRAP